MRSNIAPFTYYVVKPHGQTARVFASLAQASAAIMRLGPTPVDVSAIAGRRRRSLTVSELREVRELCRGRDLHLQQSAVDHRGEGEASAG